MRISAFAATAAILLYTVAMAAPVELMERSDELEDVFFAREPRDIHMTFVKNIDKKNNRISENIKQERIKRHQSLYSSPTE